MRCVCGRTSTVDSRTTPSGCLWRRWCPVQEGADMWGFLVCDIERTTPKGRMTLLFMLFI